MASKRVCDNCGTDITKANPIVAKLFMAPVLEGKTRSTHGNYTAHMDIGQCCVKWATKLGWQKRKTREEYTNGRRHSSADAMAARTGHQARSQK